MEMDPPESLDVEEEIKILCLLGSELIKAILGREPFENIQALIDSGAPLWYQDEVEGMSPLHAAAYVDEEDGELTKFLIDAGAVWNAGQLYTLFIVWYVM